MNRVTLTEPIVFTVDDYSSENVRLAKLLLDYHIPSVFLLELLPQQGRGTAEDSLWQISKLYSMGVEIGCHTKTHPADLKALSVIGLEEEITFSRKIIEAHIGEELAWFAYPRGRHNEQVRNYVRSNGFQYARTTVLNLDGSPDQDPMAIRANIHIYQRQEYHEEDWLQVALRYWDEHKRLHVFCHAWEIEKFQTWDKVEYLLDYITR